MLKMANLMILLAQHMHIHTQEKKTLVHNLLSKDNPRFPQALKLCMRLYRSRCSATLNSIVM